jgi:hypothetical protein
MHNLNIILITIITTVIICNTGVADRTLTLHAVPNGGSVGAVNMIVNALIVPAGDTVSFDQEKLVLGTGDQLQAVASDSGLTATVSILAV